MRYFIGWPKCQKFHFISATAFLAALLCLQASSTSYSATSSTQLKVIISGGFSAAYSRLLPEFERTTGIMVTTSSGASVGSAPTTIPSQIRNGTQADVVILAREGLQELMDGGHILPGSDTDLAHSVIGMAITAGLPHPDISTPAALREALLNAQSISVSGSASGIYLTTVLFPRLGIAEQMAPKTIFEGGAAVGSGEAQIGFQQVSELLPVEGAEFVGPIPNELQLTTTFSAAIPVNAEDREAARLLIDFLASREAAEVIAGTGMTPDKDYQLDTGRN